MNSERFNAYRIMWLFVLYDLPTQTRIQRDAAALFRKNLQKDGFNMFQFSAYIRHSMSRENRDVHRQRVLNFLPEEGHIGMLSITDKQFADMEIYDCRTAKRTNLPPTQLTLF